MAKNFLGGMGDRISKMEKSLIQDKTREYGQAFKLGIPDAEVIVNKASIQISREAEEDKKVIDMKPFFRKSPKAKRTEKGGWYLIVPIRRYTGRNADVREKASGMSNRLYKDLNKRPGGIGGQTTVISDYLYDNRKGNFSPVPELNYKPKSHNITKMENKRGRGSTYVSFRVVGSKSAPNSWLINRQHADGENLTEEVQKIVDAMKTWKGR